MDGPHGDICSSHTDNETSFTMYSAPSKVLTRTSDTSGVNSTSPLEIFTTEVI